jgi:hypothetical protein
MSIGNMLPPFIGQIDLIAVSVNDCFFHLRFPYELTWNKALKNRMAAPTNGQIQLSAVRTSTACPDLSGAGICRNTSDKPKPATTLKTLLKPKVRAVNCNALLGGIFLFGLFMGLLTFLQPFLERMLTFARRLSKQNILNADVFVKICPMDAFTFTNHPPVVALLLRAMQESRIPRQRHRHGASVGQVYHEGVFSNSNILDSGYSHFNC